MGNFEPYARPFLPIYYHQQPAVRRVQFTSQQLSEAYGVYWMEFCWNFARVGKYVLGTKLHGLNLRNVPTSWSAY